MSGSACRNCCADYGTQAKHDSRKTLHPVGTRLAAFVARQNRSVDIGAGNPVCAGAGRFAYGEIATINVTTNNY